VRNLTHFMKTKGLLPCSQKSAPCPCPETDHSNLCLLSCFFRTILISFSHQHLVLPSGLLLSIFPNKTLFAPLLCQYMPHVMALLLLLLSSSSSSSSPTPPPSHHHHHQSTLCRVFIII